MRGLGTVFEFVIITLAAVSGYQPQPVRAFAHNAIQRAAFAAQLADDTGDIFIFALLSKPHQSRVANGDGRGGAMAAVFRRAIVDLDCRIVVTVQKTALDARAGNQEAIFIAAYHLHHGDAGQLALAAQAAFATAIEQPFGAHFAQQAFQRNTVFALNIEGFGDIALGDFAVLLGDEFQHLIARWHFAHQALFFFFGAAFLRFLAGPLAMRAAMSSRPRSSVSSSGFSSFGMVALTLSYLT